MRAISQDEVKAEVAGVPTSQYKILAFAISAIFVGIAGALWGSYLTYLKPSLFLTIGIATHMVLMTVLGGGRGQWQVPSSAPSSLSPSTNSW